ncbi:hypothetical protein PCH_Pc22g12420 [Penicillium rubens Wisconsin 54-1255]|uniref:Uncharacterized protein n=1 Tax=Penicillium rubens (strain ATCC 28089 / DSM 1075 / NRRL 1951 / Wisconsin 54-1255) TaxID=500485 RepID=B6HRW0_PENRW|nr:hypothetical protein PCH_Pc22g12420 [Penicillium rubens Wisconsin 54-1255]
MISLGCLRLQAPRSYRRSWHGSHEDDLFDRAKEDAVNETETQGVGFGARREGFTCPAILDDPYEICSYDVHHNVFATKMNKLHEAQEGKSNRQYQNMRINPTPFSTAMPAHHCVRCLSSNSSSSAPAFSHSPILDSNCPLSTLLTY